jgi:hypothetical protein
MKNAAIGILFIAAIVFGGLSLHQNRRATKAQTNAQDLQQNVGDLQSSLAEQEKQTTRFRERLEETRADAAAARNEAAAQLQAARRESLTNRATPAMARGSAPTSSKAANPLAEMLKNPEMKEMLKNQQKAVLGPMIDKNYGKLFSDLRLTPEQAAAFKEMILSKQLGAAEMGMSMFTGEADAAKRAELVQQVKAASDTADAQIKEFLGDDNFTQFQAYEKTMGERMAVSGLKDQLGAGPTPLSDAQEQQLIEAMTQEHASFKFTTDFSDQSKLTADFASLFTEENMTTYFEELERLDQRYQARAQTILSPDQLSAFGKYLNNQQGLQKAGMQMALKMFAPAKPGGD